MQIVYNGDNDKRLFKEAIVSSISKLAEQDERIIYLDADLMSCDGMISWAKEHPNRAFNCGIAEANMVGVASGLAAVGFTPILHSFAPFASRRCFDQLFISAGYAKNDMTVIGTDPGICAASNGGTHMPFEDMALYRTLPTATIIDIADYNMFIDVFPKLVYMPGVKYIRTARKNEPKIYADGSKFEIGKGVVVKDGTDAVIIASGIMVSKALKAATNLSTCGISAAVIDMFTVKPIDRQLVIEYAKKTGAVVTAENHSINGGLTEAICRVLSEECPTFVESVAIDNRFGQVGTEAFLAEEYGLTAENIENKVKKVISRK